MPKPRIEDADFSNARLHAPNFEGAKITDGWFRGADISGDLEGLRLNGVEVAPLVQAERERLIRNWPRCAQRIRLDCSPHGT